MTPLGGHLAPEGSFGGLRAKNVHFPIGNLTFFKMFQNSFPCLGKSDNSENAIYSERRENNHHFLGNVSFAYVRATISVIWRGAKKGVNEALYQDGFDGCVFYQGEKHSFEKETNHTKIFKKLKKVPKCQKMHLSGNGSPEYRKQSTRRGCPTATDAPDMIYKPKLMKHVDFWRSKNSEKTNARRRSLQ